MKENKTCPNFWRKQFLYAGFFVSEGFFCFVFCIYSYSVILCDSVVGRGVVSLFLLNLGFVSLLSSKFV